MNEKVCQYPHDRPRHDGVWHSEALQDQPCRLHTVVGRRRRPTAELAGPLRLPELDGGFLLPPWPTPAVDIVIVAGPSETHAEMGLAGGRCR